MLCNSNIYIYYIVCIAVSKNKCTMDLSNSEAVSIIHVVRRSLTSYILASTSVHVFDLSYILIAFV